MSVRVKQNAESERQARRPVPLTAQTGRLVRGHLPLSVVFRVDLQGAHAKRVLSDHLDVDKAGKYRGLAIDLDLHIAEGERLVARGSVGHGGDVLVPCLRLAAGVGILQVVGQVAFEAGGILFDGGLRPAVGGLADQVGGIGRESGGSDDEDRVWRLDSCDLRLSEVSLRGRSCRRHR